MVEYWIINVLLISIPCLIYLVYNMYKDLKNKDKIIEVMKNYTDYLEKKVKL